MKEAAWRPELLQTAIVDVGVGMGRFEGRSSELYEGGRTESGESEGRELQGACLSLRGGASCWAEGRGLIASADRGVAEGMDLAGAGGGLEIDMEGVGDMVGVGVGVGVSGRVVRVSVRVSVGFWMGGGMDV